MPREYASLHRRPLFTPIWLTFLAAFLAFCFVAFLAAAAWSLGTAHATTVIVIRHAEQTDAAEDAPLSAAGQTRAASLAQMFGTAAAPGHLDAIYVSPTLRNRMTAAPLAARLGLTPLVDQPADPPALARRVLHEHAGGRTLVIGHRDAVDQIVEALSGIGHLPPISADEYGVMYVVTVPKIGRANVLRMTY